MHPRDHRVLNSLSVPRPQKQPAELAVQSVRIIRSDRRWLYLVPPDPLARDDHEVLERRPPRNVVRSHDLEASLLRESPQRVQGQVVIVNEARPLAQGELGDPRRNARDVLLAKQEDSPW